METGWKEIPNRTRTFQLAGYPELIHVIQTGSPDVYMVVYEDGYQLKTGDVEFGGKIDIEETFKIKL